MGDPNSPRFGGGFSFGTVLRRLLIVLYQTKSLALALHIIAQRIKQRFVEVAARHRAWPHPDAVLRSALPRSRRRARSGEARRSSSLSQVYDRAETMRASGQPGREPAASRVIGLTPLSYVISSWGQAGH